MLDSPFSDIDVSAERISKLSYELSTRFSKPNKIFVRTSAVRIKLNEIFEENSQLINPLDNVGQEIVSILSRIAEKSAGKLSSHMKCVSNTCASIIEKLNSDPSFVQNHPNVLNTQNISDIKMAASLHDFGKLWLPYKPWELNRPLTIQEHEQMKEHPIVGTRKLAGIVPNSVLKIIARHHKRHDGGGYPFDLAPSFESSLLHVADSYVAMRTRKNNGNRSKQFGKDESSSQLKDLSGSDFAPLITDVVLNFIEDIDEVITNYRSVG